MKYIDSLSEKTANFVTSHPYRSLIFSFISIIGLALGFINFDQDFSVRIWFKEDDPNIQLLNDFERMFGNDEYVAIAIGSDNGIFSAENLTHIRNFTAELWEITDIVRVDSLTNYQWVEAGEDDLLVEEFIPIEAVLDEQFINKKAAQAKNDEILQNYHISKDLNTALVFVRPRPYFDQASNYQVIIAEVKELIAKFSSKSSLEFHFTGAPAINDAFREISEKDMVITMPLLLCFVSIVLAFTFKNVMSIAAPLGIIILTIVMTLGFGSLVGIKFNNMVAAVPAILIAICIADCIHLLTSVHLFRTSGHENLEAIKMALLKNFRPTLMTSITTSVGFLGLSTATLAPLRELGLLAAMGTIFAWLLTIFFLLPLITLFPIKRQQKQTQKGSIIHSWQEFSPRIVSALKNRAGFICLIFMALSGLAAYLSYNNEINANAYHFFSDRVPLKQANEFMLKRVGAFAGPELVIDSKSDGGVKNPEFLKRVEQYQNWINSHARVSKTMSIVDIIKNVNRSLHGGKKDFYKLPDTRELIAQELLLYTLSLAQGQEVNDRISIDNRFLRLSVLWDIQDSATSQMEMDRLEAKAKEFGLTAHISGKMTLYDKMNDYVVSSFINSIGLALLLVCLLMIVFLRSFKLGLMSMIPNTIPLLFGGGLLFILGKDLDVGTAVVGSVCLGIAVDDTIHFISTYAQNRHKGMSCEEAICDIYRFTVPALALTTLLLVGGFGVFVVGDFVPNINFGILTSFILFMALVLDLFFLPAVIFWFDRLQAKKNWWF